MKPVRTLVLLADDQTARLLVNEGVGKGLRQIAQRTADSLDAARFHYSDTPGRERAAPGMARHGLDPRSSEERQARNAFAELVVQELRTNWDTGAHDRIVIAAAPRMLGALRERLGGLTPHVAASLDKDLVKVPISELPRQLGSLAAF